MGIVIRKILGEEELKSERSSLEKEYLDWAKVRIHKSTWKRGKKKLGDKHQADSIIDKLLKW